MLDKLTRLQYLSLLVIMGIFLQFPPLLCGFELCDSGFYLVFYENFFNAPATVEYNFMYWLSGLVGGSVMALGGESVFAIRILGVVTNLATMLCVSALLPDRKWRNTVFWGLCVVCILSWGSPLTFYYDTLTALLAVASLLTLRKGLVTESSRYRWGWLIASGFLAGINTYSRIPNVLEVGFVLIIPINSLLIEKNERGMWSAMIGFLGGWMLGISTIPALMALMGHLNLFIQNLNDLVGIARSTGAEASHGASNLIWAQISTYKKILGLCVPLWILSLMSLWVSISRMARGIKVSACILILIVSCWMLLRTDATTAMAALVFPALLVNIFFSRNNALRLASCAGLFMTIILPLGSDGAIYNMGMAAMWISIPAALGILAKKADFKYKLLQGIRPIYGVVLVGTVAIGEMVTVLKGEFYFDNTPLWEMTTQVNNHKTRGIYTSSSKALLTDSLLSAVNPYVNKGDTLLVWGSGPMLNFLTGTVPWGGVSWPEQLSASALKRELEENNAPENVLLLKFETIGFEYGKPSEAFTRGREGINYWHTEEKCNIILDYLDSPRYEILMDNPWERLYKLKR